MSNWISGPMQLPSNDHTVLAASPYRRLIGTEHPTLIHIAERDTPWKPPKDCYGGMGGNPAGGHRALCGAWGLWLWSEKQRGDRPLCTACEDVSALRLASRG